MIFASENYYFLLYFRVFLTCRLTRHAGLLTVLRSDGQVSLDHSVTALRSDNTDFAPITAVPRSTCSNCYTDSTTSPCLRTVAHLLVSK